MSEDTSGWVYTSNPQTIWDLPEHLRLTAVTEMVRRLAIEFSEAVQRDDPKSAQMAAAGAIHTIAGLFPAGDDPTHHLVHSLVGAIVSARSGSTDHILLRPGSRVAGTKGGYGGAMIAAFAVAAVHVLHNRGLSKLAARKAAAKILSDLNYSRRRGDHGEPKNVTASGIRRWEEETEANPIPALNAPKIRETVEQDIINNGLSTIEEIKGLLAEHAAALLPKAIAY